MKQSLTPGTRAWARKIVDFARNPERPHLLAWHDEPDRVVATDGHRLAWQQAWLEPREGTALVDEDGKLVEGAGEFPAYEQFVRAADAVPAARFHLDARGDWMPRLKKLVALGERAFVVWTCDGKGRMTITLIEPRLSATMDIPVGAGDPAAFRIGINARYLWDVLNAANRSGERRLFARVSIYDAVCPIHIDNDNGFYSLTMPTRLDGAFVGHPEQEEESAA